MKQIFIAIGLVILTGCSSMQPTETGFINNYRQLKQIDKRQLRYLAPTQLRPEFNSVKVTQLTLSLPQAPPQVVKDWPEEKEQILKLLLDALAPFSCSSSEADLEFRLTVSDINTSSPILNLITTAAVFIPLDNGGITIEAELINANNNQQLATWVWFEDGSVLDLLASFSSYGHAELAAQHFAVQVKQVLSQHQANQQPLFVKSELE